MEYDKIPYVDKPISKIVFGCANPVMMEGKRSTKLLDCVSDQGINTFDVAESYGESERMLGKWIKKRKKRNEVVIISKGCHPRGQSRVNPADLQTDFEQSLKRLKTDYIDIYMLHRDDNQADMEAILDFLYKNQKAGNIGTYGGSNWTHTRMEEVNELAKSRGVHPFTVSSPNFSLADQVAEPWSGSVSISGDENQDARLWYQKHEIPVFAYSCLGRGVFSGRISAEMNQKPEEHLDRFAITGYYSESNLKKLRKVEQMAKEKGCTVSQIAIAWLLNQSFQVFPIVGSSNCENIIMNSKAVDIKLNQDELLWLEK